MCLSQKLRPYGIQPRTMRIGELRAKGYFQADFMEAFRRYIPASEVQALKAEWNEDQSLANGNGRGGEPTPTA